MPYYPKLTESRTTQELSDTFGGYNHNLKIADTEFFEMQNMTSDFAPMLANRARRGIGAAISSPAGGIAAKESLAYIDAGKLYYDHAEVQTTPPMPTLTESDVQMVSMGAYLLIWPQKIYYNTADATWGYIDQTNEVSATAATPVTYELCDIEGAKYENISHERPEDPADGEYWLDESTLPHSLKQYSATTLEWLVIPTVYVKITGTGIGTGLSQFDGITLSGIEHFPDMNTSKLVQKVGENYIVVVGIIDETYTQTSGTVTAARKAPKMNYITEAENRIWGCYYGLVNGQTVNEIYCCALGDFKNWEKYQGISTDSYRASVGTDGRWTGAVTHLGYPLFFKEKCFHKVYISSSGAHQIADTACRGVKPGCSRSLAIVGDMLYYLSNSGICVFDGSLPQPIGDFFGDERYSDGCAGALESKYYLSAADSAGDWHLFVYDTAKGLMHREDSIHAVGFACVHDDLWILSQEDGGKRLLNVRGSGGDTIVTQEEPVEWSATTGLIGYTTAEQKYVSRFSLRMKLPRGSSADFWIEYDSDEIWHHCGHMVGVGTNSFLLPVRPRRCDHFRFRIDGVGDIRVYSFCKTFEQGSDVL